MIELINADCRFKFLIIDYEIQSPTSQLDAKWLKCSALLSRNTWKCEYDFTCFAEDIASLLAEIDDFLLQRRSNAKFDPLEPEMKFEIVQTGQTGQIIQISSSNIFRSANSLNCYIDFRFEIERAQIQEFARQLRLSLARFPGRIVKPATL